MIFWITIFARRFTSGNVQIKDLIPPVLARTVASWRARGNQWTGDYSSWDLARAEASGYDDMTIAQKVLQSVLKVKRGEAVYERDSLTFQEPEYVWPVLSGLLWAASLRKGRFTVLDFGGSLGSLYFQHRAFLEHLDIQWCVVEQEKFVALGKQHLEDKRLLFYADLATCLDNHQVDTILLSSVLPYVAEPYKVLRDLIEAAPPVLIFDKMPLSVEGRDRITLQRVAPAIYKATYPAWFFDRQKFMSFLEPAYHLIAEFNSPVEANIPSVFKGFIFRRNPDRP